MSLGKIPVVFLTPSSFGIVNNGPATYAKYLWEAFSDHDLFDFHLVSPKSDLQHKNIHTSGTFSSSKKQYSKLQELALQVAHSLYDGKHFPIVHGNTAHTMWRLKGYPGSVVAQINDYDASDIYNNWRDSLINYGPRRVASLIFRNSKERQATQFLTKVICNSKFTKKRVQSVYEVTPPDKLIVVYKAVDVIAFDTSKPFNKFSKTLIEGRKVLFVGSNWYRKGLDSLIHAIKLLPEELSDVSLIVAGAQGHKADKRIRQLPDQLEITDRIQFLGRVDRKELLSLLAEVDVFCLPSRQEALGVAILEALAAGLPVLSTNVGGIPEILTLLKSPALVEPDAPEQLSEKLSLLLSSEKSVYAKDSIGVAHEFSKAKMIAALIKLYNDLWSQQKAA